MKPTKVSLALALFALGCTDERIINDYVEPHRSNDVTDTTHDFSDTTNEENNDQDFPDAEQPETGESETDYQNLPRGCYEHNCVESGHLTSRSRRGPAVHQIYGNKYVVDKDGIFTGSQVCGNEVVIRVNDSPVGTLSECLTKDGKPPLIMQEDQCEELPGDLVFRVSRIYDPTNEGSQGEFGFEYCFIPAARFNQEN